MLSWFILIPLAAVIALNLPLGGLLRKRAAGLVLLVSLAQIAAVVALTPGDWSRSGPLNGLIKLDLHAGDLGLVMLLSIGLALASAVLVSRRTLTEAKSKCSFASVLLLSLMGMNGAVLVTDLFSLYVFLEIASISSFVLIGFHRDARGLEGAFKYLILAASASVLMVAGVALLFLLSGSTAFTAVADVLKASSNAPLARIAVGAFFCGLFIKGGVVPFHGWVLGAYSSGPAATSVLLAGIATKVSGIYALIRLSVTLLPASIPIQQVLLLVGAVSIVVGALAAMGQTDMRRMLAYSSISQVGYILLGVGCGSPLGVAGAVLHLFNHSVLKSLLFVNSAALQQRLGTTDMNAMGGLSIRMPATGVTSVIASLSTAGVPPFSGFWSKVIIVVALWQGHHVIYSGLAVLLSVATLAYFLILQRKVFFGMLRQEHAALREASWELVAPAVVLAIVTTGVGLLLPLLKGTFLLPLDIIKL